MELRHNEVERLLLALFSLSETQRGPLNARLKHLRRIEEKREPSGPSWNWYGVDDFLRIVLLFELIDLGLLPSRAFRIVRDGWPGIRANVANAWHDLTALESGETVEREVFGVIVHALQELGASHKMLDVKSPEQIGSTTPDAFLEWGLGNYRAFNRHGVFIDLVQLLRACCNAFATQAPKHLSAFRLAMDSLVEDGNGQAQKAV